MTGEQLRRSLYAFVITLATVLSAGVVSLTYHWVAVANASPADAPPNATIEIDKGASSNGYATPNVSMQKGGNLSAVNFDSMQHTVTSDATDANGNPLFSVYINPGTTARIAAASDLAPGQYPFHCLFHRFVMRGTLTIDGSGGGVTPSPQTFDLPLTIPPVLSTAHIRIKMRTASVQMLPHGPKTTVWTYGGSYPGPTIERPAGHDTKVTFVNDLPRAAHRVTVHFHGDHHSWQTDGQPTHFLIPRGRSRTYDWPLTDGGKPERAAFDWYHDHRMNLTAHNNWEGLQGMFIVTDPMSKQLRLPGGHYDLPLMVSERSFDANNQLTQPFPKTSSSTMVMPMTGPDAPPGDGTVGDHILVNGRYSPYLNVGTHRYRLRLLNSSPFTSYDFAMSDGQPFVQVGTGNGLLPHPAVRSDIVLGPAERADVVVDFHGELGQNVELESIASGSSGGPQTPSAQLMQFRVTKQISTDNSRLRSNLEPAPPIKVPSRVSMTWTVGLGGNSSTGTYWMLNGKPFDPKRVSIEVPLGATEKWRIRNTTTMTHFIHLHEEAWHTISYDGKRPPPWERGLEDTWQLDPGDSVVVAAKFTDYTGVFMVHCHMLDHEDHGLMAQFAVVNPKTHKLPKGYYYQPSGGARPAVTPAVRTAAPTSYADELRASPLWATIYGTRSAEGTLSRSTVERLLCT